MPTIIHQVDASTDAPFGGNPEAVGVFTGLAATVLRGELAPEPS